MGLCIYRCTRFLSILSLCFQQSFFGPWHLRHGMDCMSRNRHPKREKKSKYKKHEMSSGKGEDPFFALFLQVQCYLMLKLISSAM